MQVSHSPKMPFWSCFSQISPFSQESWSGSSQLHCSAWLCCPTATARSVASCRTSGCQHQAAQPRWFGSAWLGTASRGAAPGFPTAPPTTPQNLPRDAAPPWALGAGVCSVRPRWAPTRPERRKRPGHSVVTGIGLRSWEMVVTAVAEVSSSRSLFCPQLPVIPHLQPLSQFEGSSSSTTIPLGSDTAPTPLTFPTPSSFPALHHSPPHLS